MKKKFVITILPLVVCTLASCGGKGGGDDSNTVTFWHNCNETNAAQIQAAADAFMEANPGTTITPTKVQGSYDDLRKAVINGIATNEIPDIFYGYPDSVEEIREYGKVLDLDTFINDSEVGWKDKPADYLVPAYLKEGQNYPVKGTYSLPFAKSSECLVYNADVFNDLDLTKYSEFYANKKAKGEKYLINEEYLSTITWEEMFTELCPAVMKWDAEKDYIIKTDKYSVLAYDSDSNLFITMAEQYGSGYTKINQETQKGELLFDNTETRSTINMLRNAYKKKYLITQGANDGSYTSNLFVAKKCLFTVSSTAGVAKNCTKGTMKIGVTNIPRAQGKDYKVISQGPSIAILDRENEGRAKLAWKFYNYVLEHCSISLAINTNYFPIKTSDYSSPEYLKAATPTGQNPSATYAQGLVYQYGSKMTAGGHLFLSPVFKGSSAARNEVGALLTSALTASDADYNIDKLFETAVNNIKNKM